jgi:hypothetical protein
MKNSKQNGLVLNEKSVQKVSRQSSDKTEQRFGKSDQRYWYDVVFLPTKKRDGKAVASKFWAVKICHLGRRETFNLHTANRSDAAATAKEIYATLVGAGWDAALAVFKPQVKRKDLRTVGAFLKELRVQWAGKPKTLEDYAQKFRTMLAGIFGIKGDASRFDHINGGREKWIGRIDAIRLERVTPDRVTRWKIAFVKDAGNNPILQRRARISCNSIMRQGKSLFAPDLLKLLGTNKPAAMPFEGVKFYPRESMRYRSTVDIEALIKDAISDLPEQQLKIFLLATMVGLRRGEIDRLPWSAFRWADGVIRIEATEHFTPKTDDSSGDVPIDPELRAMFQGWHAKATSSFVIESDVEPRVGERYSHYRAQRHFDALTAWLRKKGVTAMKPIHEMRKEFGSQLCAKFGIYAASRMLRHADIAITSEHYVDTKKRVTFGMGKLLPMPENERPMNDGAGEKAPAAEETSNQG